MTQDWTTVKADDVRVGDRLRHSPGVELTVTRIDEGSYDGRRLLYFVEDSDAQWLKAPALADVDVEIRRAG